MAEEFNFEMTTKYKPEFKSQATPEQLLKQLALERVANEGRKIVRDELYDSLLDEIEKMREIVFRKNKCSVKYNLNKKLHIDIDIYSAKSDEENFNVLKLLRLIVKSNRYKGMETSKTISIINLIDKPSLDHTDYAHSMYEKHFRDIIDEIRPAVNEADSREESVNWIHSLWENIHDTLDKTILEEIQLHQGDLQAINQRLKSILDYLDKKKIAKLQRPNESIIDTFYNILISSRIIAEIEDMKRVVYTYQNEEIVPQEITNLSLDKLFSEPATWNEFQSMIDRKKVDLTDKKMQMVWSMILCKEDVTAQDLNGIKKSDYDFAKKYTETIAEYWVKEELKHETITLGEWIIVFQELMCINHNKLKYKNSYIRRNNTHTALTAAIRGFEEAPQLPHKIVLKRLRHRLLLTYGTKELFEYKLQVDAYLMEIEKIIFSYHNIEDIRTAHNFLYFQVISSLTTKKSKEHLPDEIGVLLQNQLIKNGFPPIKIIYHSWVLFEDLMNVLAQDKYFRLMQNDEFMKFRQEALQAISDNVVKGLIYMIQNKIDSHPEFAYETMVKLFAEEIQRIFNNTPPDDSPGSCSQTLNIPIYFGEGHEYYLHTKFILSHQYNVISLWWFNFTGKEIDSFDRYTELLLGMNKSSKKRKKLKRIN